MCLNRLMIWNAKHWFRWTWRLTILLCLLAWLFTRFDWQTFTQVFVAPRWDALVAMVFASLGFAFLGSAKIWVLLRALMPIRFGVVFRYFFIATSFGALTPAALGDFSMVALLKRENLPVSQGLSVMLIDRAVSVMTYALVFAPLTLGLLLVDAIIWWWIVAGGTFGTIGFLMLNASVRVRHFVRESLICRWIPTLEDFARTSSGLLRNYPWHLSVNIVLTLIRSSVAGVVVYYALLAAQTAPPLFSVICITNFLSLVNLLPISFGGLGVYEVSGVVLFEKIGLEASNALVALLYQRLYILVSSLIGLGIYSLVRVRHLSK